VIVVVGDSWFRVVGEEARGEEGSGGRRVVGEEVRGEEASQERRWRKLPGF
jgi:hypothetical protein